MLDLNLHRLGNLTLLEANGRIDSISAPQLTAVLADEIGQQRRIILDLSQINYLSGAGLRVLKNLHDQIGDVHLARPSDRVREVLQISGLDTLFRVHETRVGAIRAVSPITNAHTHLELGWLADHRPPVTGAAFMEWITGLVERRRKLDADWEKSFRKAIESAIQQLLEAGTTTVGDISTTGRSIQPLLESGLDGIVYVEVLSPRSWEADDRLNTAQAIIDQWRRRERGGLRIGLTIHAPYSTHPALWRKALEYARAENLPLCIHAAESAEELAFLTRGAGPMAEFHTRIQADFPVPLQTPIRYLEDLGALALKPLLVHAIQVSDDDIQRIKASGASVVHCPRSNLRLRCGRMPLEKYLAQGVPVYLGTDSLGSSPSLDVLEELEVAVALHFERVAPEAIERLIYQPLPR